LELLKNVLREKKWKQMEKSRVLGKWTEGVSMLAAVVTTDSGL
jgi:hypothetical protein